MYLAGVTARGRGATDRLLAAVAHRLASQGVRLAGAMRPTTAGSPADHCNSDLWLLPTGPRVCITQNLGAGSTACRMDTGAFEEAVGMTMSRMQAGDPDLFLLNKFGQREADGAGFRTAIAEALDRGVPVLTGVSDAHRDAFARFAGEMAMQLPPEEDAILAWYQGIAAHGDTETVET